MQNKDVRYASLDNIIENILSRIPPKIIKYNRELFKDAINDYYNNLKLWKRYFKTPHKLDRHKVSALTVHYFLKYLPIKRLKNSRQIAITHFINEVVAIHLGISRLNDCGSNIKIEPSIYACLLKLLRYHQKLIKTKQDIEMRHNIETISLVMYLIEKNHKKNIKLPR